MKVHIPLEKRVLAALSLLAIVGLLAVGCTATPTEVPATEVPAAEVPPTEPPAAEVPPTEVPPTEAPPTEPKVLNMSPTFDAKGLSPDMTNFWTKYGAVENLTTLNDDAALAPALALAWERTDDNSWEFELRQGVAFHNGEPFDADVAAFALNRYFGLETASGPLKGAIATAKDEFTLQITTLDPAPFLPHLFMNYTTGIMHPDAFGADGVATEVIGTGPYQVIEWVKDEHATLEKFAGYWAAEPKIDTINLLRIPDPHTRATMVRTGELDIAEGIPIADAIDMEGDGNIQVFATPQTRFRVIYLNNSAPPFDDVRVRQAINYAIDRDAMVDYVLEGYGTVAQAPFLDTLPWGNPGIDGYTYDPDKAKQLLAEAGQEQLSFRMMTYSSRAELPLLAQAAQAQLAEIGVTVDLQVTEYSALKKAVSDQDFDALLIARGPLYGGYDPTALYSSDYTTDGSYNWSLYHNGEFDARLAEAQSNDDSAARYAICQELEQDLVDQAVNAFLNYYVGLDAVRSNVSGFKPHTLELGSPMHLLDID